MIWQWVVWVAGILILATLAQVYRVQRDLFASELLKAHEWVDEIIEALEAEESDARLADLRADQRSNRIG